MRKRCFKCGIEKPLEEFYAHAKMADGHLNKCKVCTKQDAASHRSNNLDKVREYDRVRGQFPERKQQVRDRADRYESHATEWNERNPKKRAVHVITGNAGRDGVLIKPDRCERCGTATDLNAHHEDYDKPLEVVWLCSSCHGTRHREINESRRRAEHDAIPNAGT